MNEAVKFKLQSHANMILATEYDDSGDFWHYVTVSENDYGINVWDADELGDGTLTGLQISVYAVGADGKTDYTTWEKLEVEPMALKVCKARVKLLESRQNV